MAHLGGGIDELEGDLLEEHAGGLGSHGAAEGDDTTAGTSDRALEHDEVIADLTIANETTHGGDDLLGEVEGGGGVLGVNSARATDAVDLLVQVGTVVVTVLTSAGNRVHDTGRMPGTNAGNLAETAVGLAGKALDAPTVDDTLETVTLGDGADVAGLGLGEDGVNTNLLLEELLGHLDLSLDVATVDLDLLDVGLLDLDASVTELAELGVGNNADGVSLGDEGLEGAGLSDLALLGASEGLSLGEGVLGGLLPVLVVAAAELGGDVVSPDGAEALVADGGLAVGGDTDDSHGGSLKDGDGLDDLLLVDLGAGTVDVADNVGHTSLEDHEGSEVGLLLGVILGEGAAATADLAGALAGEETQMTVTGVLELAVRHDTTLWVRGKEKKQKGVRGDYLECGTKQKERSAEYNNQRQQTTSTKQ